MEYNIMELLSSLGLPKTSLDISSLPVIHEAHCCNCYFDNNGYRVWVCRCAGGVTIEKNIRGVWTTICGSCTSVL